MPGGLGLTPVRRSGQHGSGDGMYPTSVVRHDQVAGALTSWPCTKRSCGVGTDNGEYCLRTIDLSLINGLVPSCDAGPRIVGAIPTKAAVPLIAARCGRQALAKVSSGYAPRTTACGSLLAAACSRYPVNPSRFQHRQV